MKKTDEIQLATDTTLTIYDDYLILDQEGDMVSITEEEAIELYRILKQALSL